MRLNVAFREDEERIHLSASKNTEEIGVGFSETQSAVQSDYNKLRNRPSINEVILEGALSAEDLGLGRVYYDTTANWNLNPVLVSEKGAVYIYSDYEYYEDAIGNRTPIAGLRIGDGSSYLIDLPFVNSLTAHLIISHVANQTVHITEAERVFWNNKISAYIDPKDSETLILSKTHYELDGEIRSKE